MGSGPAERPLTRRTRTRQEMGLKTVFFFWMCLFLPHFAAQRSFRSWLASTPNEMTPRPESVLCKSREGGRNQLFPDTK